MNHTLRKLFMEDNRGKYCLGICSCGVDLGKSYGKNEKANTDRKYEKHVREIEVK